MRRKPVSTSDVYVDVYMMVASNRDIKLQLNPDTRADTIFGMFSSSVEDRTVNALVGSKIYS